MKKSSASHPRHALGGTLIGFVAGLLVGLGAALAVAVYVTKVPVPFVDRGLSRDAGADAKEAERNKGWNPNAAATRTPGAPTPAAPAAPEANTGAIVVPPADGTALLTHLRDEKLQRLGAPLLNKPVKPGKLRAVLSQLLQEV